MQSTGGAVDVAVVIPALNEASVIADVVTGLREHGFPLVIVVDDGSADGTGAAARGKWCGQGVRNRRCHTPKGLTKGVPRACWWGGGSKNAVSPLGEQGGLGVVYARGWGAHGPGRL